MSVQGILSPPSRAGYFGLGEASRAFRREVSDWVAEYVAPYADQVGAGAFPDRALRSAADRGYMGIVVPTHYGGIGRDHLSFALFVEELARACPSTAVVLDVHASVGTEPLLLKGTEDQRARFIPKLAAGTILGAFALTEPDAGSDAAALRTTATLEDGMYRLNGSKIFITNAGHAGLYTVLASTDRAAGARGISAFVVPAESGGLSVGPPQHKMGLLGSATADFVLRDCRVPRCNRLGDEGSGFGTAMVALDRGRIGISAQALGIARSALDTSLRILSDCYRGRQVPQGARFTLADMATHIEASRCLAWQAARDCDAGENFTTIASMAKLSTTDTAMSVTTAAIDLVAGIARPDDMAHLERSFRDAKATQLYEGTNQIQRVVIARRLLGS